MTVYSRRGLQTRVSNTLGRRIVAGSLPEGAVLDLEQVETEFSVSRTVVREAVKVLVARGLIDARPHTGTFVLPRRSWNLLDSEVMTWRSQAGPDSTLLGELDELRHMVEPWSARLAAARRTDHDLRALEESLIRMENAYQAFRDSHTDHLAEHVQADIDFHTALLAATGNELVAHMDMWLEPLLEFRDTLIPEGEQSEQFIDAHRAVFEAVKLRDSEAAGAAMTALLADAADDLLSLRAARAGASR